MSYVTSASAGENIRTDHRFRKLKPRQGIDRLTNTVKRVANYGWIIQQNRDFDKSQGPPSPLSFMLQATRGTVELTLAVESRSRTYPSDLARPEASGGHLFWVHDAEVDDFILLPRMARGDFVACNLLLSAACER